MLSVMSKEKYIELINEASKDKVQTFYQLNELKRITGLSIRTLKYRMVDVRRRYEGINSLLFKDGRRWQIHYSLLDEFMPLYKKKNTTILNYQWETMLTWNTLQPYDVGYHSYLINEIKDKTPNLNIAYCIEQDSRGVNHLHALFDGHVDEVKYQVHSTLNKYMDCKDYKSQLAAINNKYCSINYLQKAGEIKII